MHRFVSPLLMLLLLPALTHAQDRPRVEFTRMIAHFDAYSDPGYLPFVDAAQPLLIEGCQTRADACAAGPPGCGPRRSPEP